MSALQVASMPLARDANTLESRIPYLGRTLDDNFNQCVDLDLRGPSCPLRVSGRARDLYPLSKLMHSSDLNSIAWVRK
jgi:hypothetical protein